MNNPTSINTIRKQISSINDEISSLNYILESEKNVNPNDIKEQLTSLRNQKVLFKAQLNCAKEEMRKTSAVEEHKKIEDRLVNTNTVLIEINKQLDDCEKEVQDLTNQLTTLKSLQTEGIDGLEALIKDCEETIKQKREKLEELKTTNQSHYISLESDSKNQETLKIQILHLEEKTILKNKLIDCKSRLQTLHNTAIFTTTNNEIVEKEAVIKLEMKAIIKDMIHSDSFFKIKLALQHAIDELASFELLKKEGEAIANEEISNLQNRIAELEKQISTENHKAKLKEQLKEAEVTLLNLGLFLGSADMEDVSSAVEQAKAEIKKLQNEIAEITLNSLKMLNTSLQPFAQEETTGVNTSTSAERTVSTSETTSTTSTSYSTISTIKIIEELKKWLGENMLKEGLKGDVQEVIVTAALLNLTKTKTSSLTTAANNAPQSTQEKVKKLALGACEKFCMTQVVQYLVSTNPAFAVIYASAVVAQHSIFDDGQLSTLGGKLTSFTFGEIIKYAGVTILGGAITGSLGTGLAIPAAVYTLWQIWGGNNTTHSNENVSSEEVHQISREDISNAGIELIADTTVESIWNTIMAPATAAAVQL